MVSTLRPAAALLAVVTFLPPAVAADATEVQQIRQEMDQLRSSFDARMQALERRLSALQPAAAAPSSAPPPATLPMRPEPTATAVPASASAFNPSISLILAGTYSHLSNDPSSYRLQGFIPGGGDAGPGTRGFSLGESELTFAASIDPQYSGRLTMSVTGDNQVSVEEALFERQGLFDGGNLKGGRFLSSIGYLNSQHAHTWDFVDAPLAYQAFFGGPMKTDGLQLRWLAPTERFVELAAELGAGNTFPGSVGGRNGAGSLALIGHVGDDWGESSSWRAGLSFLATRASDRRYDDVDAAGATVTNSFSGNSRTWVLDGIWKWAPGGNATQTNFKLQGEFMQRTEDGTLSHDLAGAGASGGYRSTQSGGYVQAVYQFMPMWRAGLRYDRLDSGTVRNGLVDSGGASAADFLLLQAARPTRTSLMLDYTPSEFSRFRLQLASDHSNPAAATDQQLYLQYIMSLGAHGAHSF